MRCCAAHGSPLSLSRPDGRVRVIRSTQARGRQTPQLCPLPLQNGEATQEIPTGIFNARNVRNSDSVKPTLEAFVLDFEVLIRLVASANQGAVVHAEGLRTASTTCRIASITSCGSWT
jgi:hypothetical protein